MLISNPIPKISYYKHRFGPMKKRYLKTDSIFDTDRFSLCEWHLFFNQLLGGVLIVVLDITYFIQTLIVIATLYSLFDVLRNMH